MDSETKAFQADLLASVEQMNNGEATRVTEVALSPVAAARARVGVTQQEFAVLLGVSLRTLQDWEREHREPTTGAVKVLLRIARRHPEVLREPGLQE